MFRKTFLLAIQTVRSHVPVETTNSSKTGTHFILYKLHIQRSTIHSDYALCSWEFFDASWYDSWQFPWVREFLIWLSMYKIYMTEICTL